MVALWGVGWGGGRGWDQLLLLQELSQGQRKWGDGLKASDRLPRPEDGEIWSRAQGCPRYRSPLGKLPFHMVGGGHCNFSLRVNCLADSTDN